MSVAEIFATATGIGALVALYFAFRPAALHHEPPLPPRDPEADARDGLDWEPDPQPAGPDGQVPPMMQTLQPSEDGAGQSRKRDKGPGWAKTGSRDIVIGLSLLIASVTPFFIPVGLVERMLGCAVLLGAGLMMMRRGSSRQHGLALERRALKKIKLPPGWEMETSVAITGKGDADLLITSPEELRYVVEIKAQRDIVLKRGFLGGGAQILGKGGKKMPRDPLHQVLALGGILQAFPVLWFPDGRGKPITKIGNPEVIIVQGKEKVLLKAIGARRGFF